MKPFAVFALLIAGVSAGTYQMDSYGAAVKSDSYGYGSPSPAVKVVPIVSYTNEIRGSESSALKYETGDGIHVSDNTQRVAGRGGLYDDGTGKMVESDSLIKKSGSYSYTAPDGTPISVNWVADEGGFRAEGAHLPKPVEMPAELKAAYQEALSRAPAPSSDSYGYAAPAVRSSYEAPAIRSSYEAPAIRSSYEAPAVKSSYEAPAVVRVSYEAPAIKSTYEAPAVKSTYEAPAVKSSYEAPAIRVQSYDAPAPQIRNSGY